MWDYFLRGVLVQNTQIFENFDLPLSCQVLISEKDNTALIN